MAIFSVPNVKIAGISACVPPKSVSNHDYEYITQKDRELLIKTTGIEKRRYAAPLVTTSDLCYQAAQKLLSEMAWQPDEVDLLVFVSQSRDYFLPATAIVLQNRLGLSKSTLAFDISLGCSGYVYGLSVISSLVSQGGLKKGLLMVGDISTFSLNEKDKSTYPLFGDAGTVTALEFQPGAKMNFNLQSDGSGAEAIIIPDGGLRNPLNEDSYIEREIEPGVVRNKRNLSLDGLEVFNFSLREVAPNIKALLESTNETTDDYDFYVLHQANKLMNESIRKKLKIGPEKVPYSLDEYGNTSSASIPLTIVSRMREVVATQKTKNIFSGFGVGLSWGSVSLEMDCIVCPDVIDYE